MSGSWTGAELLVSWPPARHSPRRSHVAQPATQPVPCATVHPELYRRRGGVLRCYFGERLNEGDDDPEVCAMNAGAGLEYGSTVQDTLLAGDLPITWAEPDYNDKTFQAIHEEIKLGAFRCFSLHAGLGARKVVWEVTAELRAR